MPVKLWVLLIAGLIALFPKAYAQEYSPSWKDINYVGDTMLSHRLDIYLPKGDKNAYPVIILIYGSAWFSNDLKEQAFNLLGKPLIKNGFAVVSINHRSSHEAKFPAQIQDAKAAVRYIRANATQYQIDASFIGVTGYSSGGHLSALLGTSGQVRQHAIHHVTMDIEGNLGRFTEASSTVDAVVDWYGPTDFQVMDSCGSEMIHAAPDSPESSLIGGEIMENDEKCALANPITYIDAGDPPFLILHGNEDTLVPYCQSVMLHKALEEGGVESELIIVPGGKHGPGVMEKPYYKRMVDFFKEAYAQKNRN